MARLDWDDLRVFLAILRTGSVRSASQFLSISHSTVSRRLAGMEDDLGCKLFLRQADGLIPTETGEAILERAERVEAEIFNLERDVLGRDARLSGPIRITMPPPLAHSLLMPHIARFARLYPELNIEIVATYGVADLAQRNADIAIRFQDKPEDFLVGRRLPAFANAVYASPDYLANHSLGGEAPSARWIGWGNSRMQPDWRQAKPFSKIRVDHCASDPMSQLAAAKEGLGLAYFLCFLGDREPGLVRVPPGQTYPERAGWVLTHPDLITSARVRTCVRFLVDSFSEHADLLGGFQSR